MILVMCFMRKLGRGLELFIFVLVVLMIAWVPLIIFKPMPDRVAENLLSGDVDLFGEVPGYSRLVVDESMEDIVKGSMVGAEDLMGDSYFSSYVYWKEDDQVLLVLKKVGSDSARFLEDDLEEKGWSVDLEQELVFDTMRARGFRGTLDGEFVSVIYWRIPLFKRDSKLLFFSTPRGKETLIISIASPLDVDADKRLGSIADGAVLPVLNKLYGVE